MDFFEILYHFVTLLSQVEETDHTARLPLSMEVLEHLSDTGELQKQELNDLLISGRMSNIDVQTTL